LSDDRTVYSELVKWLPKLVNKIIKTHLRPFYYIIIFMQKIKFCVKWSEPCLVSALRAWSFQDPASTCCRSSVKCLKRSGQFAAVLYVLSFNCNLKPKNIFSFVFLQFSSLRTWAGWNQGDQMSLWKNRRTHFFRQNYCIILTVGEK
jgi:hypothetical protein